MAREFLNFSLGNWDLRHDTEGRQRSEQLRLHTGSGPHLPLWVGGHRQRGLHPGLPGLPSLHPDPQSVLEAVGEEGGVSCSQKKKKNIPALKSKVSVFRNIVRNHVSSPLLRVVRGLEWISSSQSLGKRAAASRASSSAIWWENTRRLTSVYFLIWLITINHNRKSLWLIMINWDTANQWLPTVFGLWPQVDFTNCWQFLTTSGTFFFFFWQKSCKPNLYWLCFQINPETGVLEEENLTPCRRLSAFLDV